MTHTDAVPTRKPRRLGLYGPFAIALILIVGWSGVWFWMKAQTEQRIDAGAAALRKAGWQVSWTGRDVGGWPYRLDADFTGLTVIDPSGLGVMLPALRSEAYVFAPTRWIFAAPAGATLFRPEGGPVRVDATTLRLSVNSWDQHPPRLSLVGDDLAFTPALGAQPFFLSHAKVLQFYTRAGPDDQGAFYLSVDGGEATPGGALAQVAGAGATSLTLNASFSRATSWQGPSWKTSVANWSLGGGAFSLLKFQLAGPQRALEAHAGAFAVGPDGWLTGDVAVSDTEGGHTLPAQLTFKDGSASLGPAKLGPAPRLF